MCGFNTFRKHIFHRIRECNSLFPGLSDSNNAFEIVCSKVSYYNVRVTRHRLAWNVAIPAQQDKNQDYLKISVPTVSQQISVQTRSVPLKLWNSSRRCPILIGRVHLVYVNLCRRRIIGPRRTHSVNNMRPIATDGVAWSVCMSVCLLVTFVSSAEQIKMLIRGILGWAQR